MFDRSRALRYADGVDRYWVSSTDAMQSLTRDGWAAAPSLWGPDSVPTRELADARCLVLLGEPGIGKTTAVRDLSVLAPGCCDIDSVFKVDLVGKARESSVRREFERVLDQAGDGPVCLTVDGFDEAQRQISGLFSVILDYLQDLGPERLWFRIVSRASDWERRYTNELEEQFSECTSMLMLPLTRANTRELVLTLAKSVDAQRFLSDVERAGVEAIAARPLTLEMLLAAYETDGELPRRSAELYNRGLSALCEELSEDRAPRQPRLLPGRAMEIAARTAAVMAFGAKASIWLGPEVNASPDDATMSQCVDSDADWPSSFAAAELEQVWRGGLFNGTDRRVWAHVTFGDYLAARWIAAHKLAESQVRALFVADQSEYLYSQTRAVAAWLVALSPDDYGWLVDVDPAAFTLGTDLPTDELRELVARAVLCGDAVLDYRERTDYRTLRYPGLSHVLREVIPTADAATLEVAAAIAVQCETHDIAEVFGRIALDPHRSVRKRLVAATACQVLSSAQPTDQLVPLARDSEETRGELDLVGRLELQGIGLRASFPHAMTTEDVLAVLTPHDVGNVRGQHWLFLRDFAEQLDDRDADVLATWTVKHPAAIRDENYEYFVQKATQILVHAIDSSNEIADAAAQVATARASEAQPLFVERVLEETPTLTISERQRLALVVFAQAALDQVLTIMTSGFVNDNEALLPPSSLDWLVEQYSLADRHSVQAQNTRTALTLLVCPDDPEHAATVLGLPDDHPAAEAFAHLRGDCRLDSPEARAHRQRLQRMKDSQAKLEERKLQVNVADAIEQLALSASGGEYDCIAEIFQLLVVRDDRLGADHDIADITNRPAWIACGADTQQRILDNAETWLTEHDDSETATAGSHLGYWPSHVGYRMLVALLHQRPEALKKLPASTWRRWSRALLTFPVLGRRDDTEDKARLFDLALPLVRDHLEQQMQRLIDAAVKNQEYFTVTPELDMLDTPAFAQILLNRYQIRTPQTPAEWNVLSFLTDNHFGLVRPLLNDQLKSVGEDAREASVNAGVALFRDNPEQAWGDIWERAEGDPDWLLDSFGRIAELDRYRAPALTAGHLADLYLWLRNNIADPDPTRPGMAHFLDRRDFVETWRSTMVQHFIESATEADVAALNRILDADPGTPGLKAALGLARRNHASRQWSPLTVEDLDALAADPRRMPIRTSQDLRIATLAALTDIQAALQGDTPEAPLLWDTHAKRPKSEDEVSDYLRNKLQAIVEGAVVNREVQVRNRTGRGMGERTDLRIEARTPDTSSTPVVFPIEVKGCWHDDLETAWEEQLLNRYMADIHTSDGIYLLIWFDQKSWDKCDQRKRKAARYSSVSDLENRMSGLIAERGLSVATIDVVVLDASRDRPSVETSSSSTASSV